MCDGKQWYDVEVDYIKKCSNCGAEAENLIGIKILTRHRYKLKKENGLSDEQDTVYTICRYCLKLLYSKAVDLEWQRRKNIKI